MIVPATGVAGVGAVSEAEVTGALSAAALPASLVAALVDAESAVTVLVSVLTRAAFAAFGALVLATEVDGESLSAADSVCITGCEAVAIGAGAGLVALSLFMLGLTGATGAIVEAAAGGAKSRVGADVCVAGCAAAGWGAAAGGVIVFGALADVSTACAKATVEDMAKTAAIAVRPGRSGLMFLVMTDQSPLGG
jgi:hypothetical protein